MTLILLSAADAHASNVIAVLPLDVSHAGGRLSVDAQASLEETLRDVSVNVLGTHGWTILTGETTLQVLQDNGVDPAKCGDQACHLTMAREIKADRFITGSVQYDDNELTASIRLVDTSTGRITSSLRLEGDSPKALRKILDTEARDFFSRGGLIDVDATPLPAGNNESRLKPGEETRAFGKITVSVRPKESAQLALIDPDGRTYTSGAVYENAEARPGRWLVHAKAAGLEEQTRDVEMAPGGTILVNLDLKPFGTLRIVGAPLDTSVVVTGPGNFRGVGELPWEATGLKSGSYEVRATHDGYVEATQRITVVSGKTVQLNLSMAGADTTPRQEQGTSAEELRNWRVSLNLASSSGILGVEVERRLSDHIGLSINAGLEPGIALNVHPFSKNGGLFFEAGGGVLLGTAVSAVSAGYDFRPLPSWSIRLGFGALFADNASPGPHPLPVLSMGGVF